MNFKWSEVLCSTLLTSWLVLWYHSVGYLLIIMLCYYYVTLYQLYEHFILYLWFSDAIKCRMMKEHVLSNKSIKCSLCHKVPVICAHIKHIKLSQFSAFNGSLPFILCIIAHPLGKPFPLCFMITFTRLTSFQPAHRCHKDKGEGCHLSNMAAMKCYLPWQESN